ncbi:MAG: NlpC/P60 family protein [Candidatus Magnetoovum sp. WYHC-5]|nr:NlpC/P60 family protein [Candidatus Magnetoovum sp. WYHC-5]
MESIRLIVHTKTCNLISIDKQLILFASLVLFLFAGCAKSYTFKGRQDVYSILEKTVPKQSKRYIGLPYKLGSNPDRLPSTDCSNLISAITRNSVDDYGLEFSPYYLQSSKIYENSHKITKKEARTGDLMFFRQSKPEGNHVGIIVKKEKGNFYFVHASSTVGVTITSTASPPWEYYWKNRFHSYRRWNMNVFLELN